MSDSEHFVQFYESDEYLIDSVRGFVGAALAEGQASIVIATSDHRNSLQRKLVASGVNVADAIEVGRYVVLDAAETLSKFMIDGMPDARRFKETIGAVVAQLCQGGRRIHAFGEMVALLWRDGNRDGAIRLEELWNELGKTYRFALFCAYAMDGFDENAHAASFDGVCSCHSRVIPSESYSALSTREERLRAITMLQQKAQSLEAEIKHRQAVDDQLSKRERELSDFFENATEGLHKVGADGTILWANKAEYGLLGYTADEYIGRPITDFHADADVIAEMLEKLKRGETLENFPARLRCKDGRICRVLVSSNACFENGKFLYTRCFTRDVTRQHLAEDALREADRRKDEFLATLAHELRNPLAPIRNALELLRIVGNPDLPSQDARDVIDRQVSQLTRLVDDLLDVSRITRDKIVLRNERVELSALINTAIETSRPAIELAGHRLTIDVSSTPVYLDVDPTRIAQVVSNLLNNSAKYTPSGGQISIRAMRQQSHVRISVRDNGVGISCEALAYVFDMFRQVDHSLDRAQGGLGIGLTLVRRLVELHGGTVEALSDGTGKGSEFVVQLPVAAGDPVAKPSNGTKPQTTLKHRILVVDDNKDAGQTLFHLLRLKGHDVRFVQNGFDAIKFVEEYMPQVILMDVGMPKLDGYETTKRIREMAVANQPVIIAVTGWGQNEDKRRSYEAGCSAHLVKPVDLAELDRVLMNLPALAT